MPRKRGPGPAGRKRGGGSSSSRFTKKKPKKDSSGRGRGPANVPEFMDLEGDIYIPDIRALVPKNSMRNGASRPARLAREGVYTERNIERTMSQPLRNRPIEFVKAKEVYDPSADLFKQVRKDRERQLEEPTLEGRDALTLLEEMHSLKMDEVAVVSVENTENEVVTENAEENHEMEQDDAIEDPEEATRNGSSPNEGAFTSSSTLEEPCETPVSDHVNSDAIAVDQITETQPEPDFIIDNDGDEALSRDPRPYTPHLLQTTEHGSNLEFSPTLTVGKVSLLTSTDAQGEISTKLMAIKGSRAPRQTNSLDGLDSEEEHDKDVMGYQDYINQLMSAMRDNSDYEEDSPYESDTNFDVMASSSDDESEEIEASPEEEQNPEYGFLEEDYEFDVSQIEVSNVRFGVHNQYYTKCAELTGLSTEFQWIDADELTDFVLLKGVKEHRLDSFMTFVTKGLLDEKPFEVPNYSDVYISETSEEEEETADDDGLADIVSFAKTMPPTMTDLDFPPTRSLSTKGKGKNKKLDLDHVELDLETIQSLQDQYALHRKAKKARKDRNDVEKYEEGIDKHDLLVKYPYALHIKDIRQEFEFFLHDSGRQTMSFPPLDPHGHKTISKMASCYNMKATKCGPNGLKLFMKVAKNRKTFHYLPRMDGVAKLLRQRPVFNRVDVKRPKDEAIRTDGNAKKDRARGRNKNKVAVLREGDIVGAEAPEISQSNIGRQLLEKLGWSQGEGLGAHGNKGISEPVMAKIKKSKTGLK